MFALSIPVVLLSVVFSWVPLLSSSLSFLATVCLRAALFLVMHIPEVGVFSMYGISSEVFRLCLCLCLILADRVAVKDRAPWRACL